MTKCTIKLSADSFRRFSALRSSGGFQNRQAFVEHLLDLEEKRQTKLCASFNFPACSTPVKNTTATLEPGFGESSPVQRRDVSCASFIDVVSKTPEKSFDYDSCSIQSQSGQGYRSLLPSGDGKTDTAEAESISDKSDCESSLADSVESFDDVEDERVFFSANMSFDILSDSETQ